MTDVADEVKQAWETVHEKLEDASTRVNREAFVEYCKSKVSEDSPKQEEYEAYLNKLFDTATALMLPSEKTDLGKHCFGYATILAEEFYFDQPADKLSLKADEKPDDRLSEVRQALDADWEGVDKDDEGRVGMDGFVGYFMKKYTEKVAPESQESYKSFLEKDFNSSLAMMLPAEKTNLGGHCFRYAALLAGEFYFEAGNVADILKVAQSAPKVEEKAEDEKPAADADAEAEKKAAEEKAAAETAEAEAAAAAAAEAEKKAAEEKAAADKDAAAAAEAKKADEKAAAPAAAPAAAAAGTFPIEELQGGCPAGVSATAKETYLSDADFQLHLKMPRGDFAKLPKWKQDAAKKACKIF